ncbi:meiosis-specific coiled-coil domain-containing protein MEIOC-like [Lampris incognitus]|uniref:meiosis-specific coiled-coil domain-containing protein MEIOC-like n=1 Tax=Lampris incognitus TaxID=2546036 RepID=UPI0024B56CA3|nr:meiosis-specific coiled-coil domain-containing protein MEIOC-like [Lampris incognitus]
MVSGNTTVISEVKMAVQENTKQITAVKESFDAVCAEINDMKDRVVNVESQLEKYKAYAETQEKRISHLESYSRRWNLKLYGLAEKAKQDLRQEVIQVCQSVLPDAKDKLPDVVDTVHRLGPKKPSNNHPRGVIMQFTSRVHRDAVWRAAKKSAFLKDNNLKLAEDLSADDRDRRNRLWPAVDKARKDNKNLNDGMACEVETDLCGLVSNILDDADPLDSYHAEQNLSKLETIWSPKTTREDDLHYIQSESNTKPNPVFLLNHTYPRSLGKAPGQNTAVNRKNVRQQFIGFDTNESFTPCSGDMDTYSHFVQPPLPPGLPVPTVENFQLSKMRQSEDVSPTNKDRGKYEFSDLSDLNGASAPQSKMSSLLFDPYYQDNSCQSSVSPIRNRRHLPEEDNKLVSNVQAFITGEQDHLHGREYHNTNRRYYEDNIVEQEKFTRPAMSTHTTPTVQIQNELVGQFGAMKMDQDEGVRKHTFQVDFDSQAQSRFIPQNTEYFHQPQPLSASFNYLKPYQNNELTNREDTCLPMSITTSQSSQYHSLPSQLHNQLRLPRDPWVPSNPTKMMFQSASELPPQYPHAMQRAPMCPQDYSLLDGTHINCWPGQAQVRTDVNSIRKGRGDSMQLERSSAYMGDFLEERSIRHLDCNTTPQKRTVISNVAKNEDPPQSPLCDFMGSMYNSERFEGQNAAVNVGKTPQFLPYMCPPREPRQNSWQVSCNSAISRSSLASGNSTPPMDCGDMLPANLTTSSPYFSDLSGCSRKNIDPGMGSVLKTKIEEESKNQLHFYLEKCYEQLRCLKKERKKMEVTVSMLFPGTLLRLVNNSALPKMPPNPTTVDCLVVDQICEQAKVVSLLVRMETLFSFTLHANIKSALDRHNEAIRVAQARCEREFVTMSNRQRQGAAHFKKNKDILLLATALKDLCVTTRETRTVLWCALQMATPITEEEARRPR